MNFKDLLNKAIKFFKSNKEFFAVGLIVIALALFLSGPSILFFEDGKKEDVVYGVAKGSKTKDEWKDMSADDCKQIAEDSDGKYIAWGHHGEDHEDEDKKNSCFMYTKIKPYKGDKDDETNFMACTDPSMSILNGCKPAKPDGDDEDDEEEEKEDVADELEELLEDL